MAKIPGAYMAHFSTSTKLLINEWSTLHSTVLSYCSAPINSDINTDTNPLLIDDTYLEDAYNGPLSVFFRLVTGSLSQLKQIRTAISLSSDNELNATDDLQDQFACKDIDLEYVSAPKVDNLIKQIEESIPERYQLWLSLYQDSCESIIKTLRELDLALNEDETGELIVLDTRHTLLKRLDTLAIEPFKETEVLELVSYMQLKSQITIKSALSRTHQPHQDSDIKRISRKLKSCFDSLKKDQLNLQKTQLQELDAEIKTILPE